MPVKFWSGLLSWKDYMGSEVWEMNLKVINRETALDAIEDGKDVYIIRPVSLDSAVLLRDLLKLEFAIEEPEICRGTDAPEPPKEAGGKTSARKKLDWGKIEALDKAGWSAEQIADEMGATVGTIYVGLSKRRKGAENWKTETGKADTGTEEGNQ